MIRIFIVFCALHLLIENNHAQVINAFAGTGMAGNTGDGGSALSASFNNPNGITIDNAGSVYIADRLNHKVRKISAAGIVTTVAGNGSAGYSGDGGQATLASLNNPYSVAVDPTGNIYIAETEFHRIRKVATNGVISTFAGTSVAGYSGDGGQASLAQLNFPIAVNIDNSGNILITDRNNSRIRKVATNGIISTIAGLGLAGFGGDGGQATGARIFYPTSVDMDASGNLYIADAGNYRIRRVATNGVITTIAGNGDVGFNGDGDGGSALACSFRSISGLGIDAGGLVYVLDANRIRKISAGLITTIAGNGTSGNTGNGGSPLLAIVAPASMDFAPNGRLLFSDVQNHLLRSIHYDLVVSSFSPNTASAGQVVNITGSGFTNISNVSFGGTSAAFTVNSSTSISATLGSGATGFVSVTNPTGTAGLPGFTFSGPTISSFSPLSATTGNTVTITGTNLSGATAVSFGGVPAASFTVVSATSISAVVAAGSSGAVAVTTPLGTATITGFSFSGPIVSSFSPASAGPGMTVNIYGTNFGGTTAVSFGGTPVTSFTVPSTTFIAAVLGNGSTGSISVTSANGNSTKTGFTFVPAPTITSFTPTGGGIGNTISITGSNFIGATAVKFGNINASSFTVVNANTITAVLATSTSGNVSVTTAGGTANKAGFTFFPPPTINSLSSSTGGTGSVITLTGINFTGATSVTFGGIEASSFTVVSPTSITATVAAGASGSVVLTTPGGITSRSGFTFIPAPVISSISPNTAGAGATVTITGSNFTGTSAVKFGGTTAVSFTVNSSTSISAVVGTGTSGSVSVTTVGGTGTFAGFNHIPLPVISSFTPTWAGFGLPVTITGTNFTGATAVSFGNIPASSFTVVSATTITAIVSGGGATGSISVTTPGGAASLNGFTYLYPPAISSFSPASAGQGTVVTVSGANFTGATEVSLGGIPAQSFNVASTSIIYAVVGAGNTGSLSIKTAGGTGTRAGFTFIPAPSVSSFTPANAAQGATVTITGTNFTGVTGVQFGGTAATSFVVVNATTITAVVSNGTSGTVSVTAAGGNASKTGFNFIPPPTISFFSPVSADQNSTVTISGTNFTGASAVSFGGIAATSFSVTNATTISAVVGTGASGNVSLTASGGTATKAGFTFIPGPGITSFTPVSATTGATISIMGTNFTGATAVSFGGVAAASFSVVNANTITAVLGNGNTGNVVVTTPNGTASKSGFTFSGMVISSFTPTTAKTGTTISINGANFSAVTEVRLGGRQVSSFQIVDNSTITAIVGSGASGEVQLISATDTATKGGFVFLVPPAIDGFSPAKGITGTVVTILGTNFSNASMVKFGGILASSFTVVSATKITAVVSASKSGMVEVTTPVGSASKAGFIYDLTACAGGNTLVYAPVTGTTYQWQVNTNNSFSNITNGANFSGTNTSTLQLLNIPATWSGNEYRCVVDGKATAAYQLRVSNTWKGTVNNSWENAQNWGCGILPDSNTYVYIPRNAFIVVNSNDTVRSVQIDYGANVSISGGKALLVTGSSNTIKISKVELEAQSYQLLGNTPGLLLAPGESVSYKVKKFGKSLADSVPVGLVFTNSNPAVATISVVGTVNALTVGSTLITATDAGGKNVRLFVTVQASNLPLLSDPQFAGFSHPLYVFKSDSAARVNVKVLNRLGNELLIPATIQAKGINSDIEFSSTASVKIPEGGYSLQVKASDKILQGDATLLSFNINASGIFTTTRMIAANETKTKVTDGFTQTPPGLPRVFHIALDPGLVPSYFTRNGLTSKTFTGTLFTLVAVEETVNGFPTGNFAIDVIVSNDILDVEVGKGTVLAGGTSLTSVGPGLESWRINHLGYTGFWNNTRVFYDFTGDWTCKDDQYGHSVKLRVPRVPDYIYYPPELPLFTPYTSFIEVYTPGFAQKINADAEFNGVSAIDFVQIGPNSYAYGPGFVEQTKPLQFGDASGAMFFNYYYRYGQITYVDEREFRFSGRQTGDPEIPYYRPEAIFIRNGFTFSPVISSFSPLSGVQGTIITIKGKNFTNATAVKFGGVNATSFTVVDDNTINAVVGPGVSGPVTVTSVGGTGSKAGFLFINPTAPPKIISFLPTSATQGQTVTIYGVNFTGASAVSLGGVAVGSFTVLNDTRIQVVVAAGASGEVRVVTSRGVATMPGFFYGSRRLEYFEVTAGDEKISFPSFLTDNGYSGWFIRGDSLADAYGNVGRYSIRISGQYFTTLTEGYAYIIGSTTYPITDTTKIDLGFKRPDPVTGLDPYNYPEIQGTITFQQECIDLGGYSYPYWVGFIDAVATEYSGGQVFRTYSLIGSFRFSEIAFFEQRLCE